MASILDPKDPDPYYRSALCYLSLKQDKEAIKSLQLALTHSHNHPSFRSIELQSEEWLKKIGRG
jgi:regulator of sirC expression with transglutaminase-like and TPR domain